MSPSPQGGDASAPRAALVSQGAAAGMEQGRHEGDSEARYRELAAGQAALRRVATLVAVNAPEREVLDNVAKEVGLLVDADLASLVRNDGETVEIVAGWSRSPELAVPNGLVVEIDRATATKKALMTGSPARADAPEMLSDDVAQVVRDLSITSAVAAPVTVNGSVWGAVTAARTRRDPLPAEAETRLGDFAELVAQAIANAEAQEELAASRLRIVEAGDAERRRIERNLHDGAQQRLVTTLLALRIAQSKVAEDDPVAPMLEQACAELSHGLVELREIARGIHPATLTEHGLAAALRALAGRSALSVEVSVRGVDVLPDAVAATVYYIVAESLTNAVKHARASAAHVCVERLDETVRVEVGDDGVGGATMPAGSGLCGLADRVQALRGTIAVASPPDGGTTITASIPVPAPGALAATTSSS